jgi:hypothetical protein
MALWLLEPRGEPTARQRAAMEEEVFKDYEEKDD